MALLVGWWAASCATLSSSSGVRERDPHSFSNPDEIAVTHLALDLSVDFERRVIRGAATWSLRHLQDASVLVLDSNKLNIKDVTLDEGTPTEFEIGASQKHLGEPLRIQVRPNTRTVTISYETSPEAEALQWLSPPQTANRAHPFLYSQSQPIFARTWIPCQDSPGVRFTYEAKVSVPPDLMAVMSATNPKKKNKRGFFEFRMPQPIPAYLLALAVGDLQYRSFDRRSGVYAESRLLGQAYSEFREVPKMIAAAEKLFGPYPWDQYDVLVLPPSFPFGGMENPRLSFLTPSLLAGDRSLVSVVSHELAHSWTGNLVTNQNLNHFWLNEGFTVFAERRIIEALYGTGARDLQAKNGETDLVETVQGFLKENPEFSKLRLNLSPETNPDDAYSSVPYEKGYLFLRSIENEVGRETFDRFLRKYIDQFQWKTIHTEQFLVFLEEELIRGDAGLRERLHLQKWLYEPGLPEERPVIESEALHAADFAASRFAATGEFDRVALRKFSAYQWLRFISEIPRSTSFAHLELLDESEKLSQSSNAEIAFAWLKLGLEARNPAALKPVERFLATTGRGKFVNPLFKLLIQNPDTRGWGVDLYRKLKPTYHSIVQNRIEKLLRESVR